MVLSRGDLPLTGLGSVWRHVWLGLGQRATIIQLVETRDIAKYPTMHRAGSSPEQNNHLAQDVNTVELKKPWSKSNFEF